jgi:hypothetical protein
MGGEKRRLRVDILRSRFSSIAYIPQIKEANDFVTPDAEKWLPELSAPHADGPSCHRRCHPAKK